MKLRLFALIAILVMCSNTTAWSQVYTETTTRVEPVIVTGEVVWLEPGKTIVVRSGGEEVSYVLAPHVVLPPEVQIGGSVTMQLTPGPDGSTLVRQVTTTTVTDEGQVKRRTEVTRTRPYGETTTTTTTTTGSVITGEVIRLEPGKTIVLRSDGRETRYILNPEVSLPAEIQVGRNATVQFEPGPDGTSLVKRVTTTTVSPEGQMKQTTEITRTNPTGDTTRTTMSTLAGRVEAYQPGKSVTVIDRNGARITYLLSAESQIPSEVIIGKEATVYMVPKEHGARVIYEIQRDGNTIKIKAKTKR